MTSNRTRFLLLVAATIALAGRAAAQTGGPAYSVDILSDQYYPQLKDAWMYRINNNGVAAGYIATDGAGGPFLPAMISTSCIMGCSAGLKKCRLSMFLRLPPPSAK